MEQRAELRRGLVELDGAIFFILLLIVSILVSYWSMRIQRRQVLAALQGESLDPVPSPLSLKCIASALSIGSLGFFLRLSLDTLRRSQNSADLLAKRSAQINVLASTLVMGAALLRFYDLLLVESGGMSALELAETDDLPPV